MEEAEPDFWEQFLSSSSGTNFLRDKPRWVTEILKSAARASKKELADLIEAASWVTEHTRLQKEAVKWILPNVSVSSDSSTDQIDVCSLFLRGTTTVIRLIECTKSDSENKAVDDLEKLEKIKNKCRTFEDLEIEQLIYGASSVRDHFAPVQQMLGQFRIRSR